VDGSTRAWAGCALTRTVSVPRGGSSTSQRSPREAPRAELPAAAGEAAQRDDEVGDLALAGVAHAQDERGALCDPLRARKPHGLDRHVVGPARAPGRARVAASAGGEARRRGNARDEDDVDRSRLNAAST